MYKRLFIKKKINGYQRFKVQNNYMFLYFI